MSHSEQPSSEYPDRVIDTESAPEPFFMDDGMDPVAVPERITRDNVTQIFGQALPEGLSPDLFGEGDVTLDLSQD